MIRGMFQPWHLIIILGIVLIVFGPGKLSDIGGALGKSIREFKRGTADGSEAAAAQPATTAQSAAEGRKCPACEAENLATSDFCGQCGKKLAA